MNFLEKAAKAARHSRLFKHADQFWAAIRPFYRLVLRRFWKRGLERKINGVDPILISPELYDSVSESYEPDVWKAIMEATRPGYRVADVGAFIGLYTVALARHVGDRGQVWAFEPNPQTASRLRLHVKLNNVQNRVCILQCAVGDHHGEVAFTADRSSESHINTSTQTSKDRTVQMVTLDSIFAESRLDILKIDVEGYEEHVLRGGERLLTDAERAPSTIFIEVHPFAWNQVGVSSSSLLGLLCSYNYQVFDLEGKEVHQISKYGEIVARRRVSHPIG
jgi:FkbM family methyltransferase